MQWTNDVPNCAQNEKLFNCYEKYMIMIGKCYLSNFSVSGIKRFSCSCPATWNVYKLLINSYTYERWECKLNTGYNVCINAILPSVYEFSFLLMFLFILFADQIIWDSLHSPNTFEFWCLYSNRQLHSFLHVRIRFFSLSLIIHTLDGIRWSMQFHTIPFQKIFQLKNLSFDVSKMLHFPSWCDECISII